MTVIRNQLSAIRNSGIMAPLLLAALVSAPLPVLADSSPIVRLLLSENQPRVVVSGTSVLLESREKGHWQKALASVRLTAFAADSGGVRLEGTEAVALAFGIRPKAGILHYAGMALRGELRILPSGGGLMVVSHMPLDSYLAGVVNGEIDSQWPMAAVKAQVVASRSYALYRIGSALPFYDLRSDITDQVYAGPGSEDERAAEAVSATRGQVLYSGQEMVQAFFHSSCGGSTASAREVWGLRQPAQEGVRCGACTQAPYSSWKVAVEPRELARIVRALFPDSGKVRELGIHSRSPEGRVQTLFARTDKGRILIDAGDFRREMGYRRLPSTMFRFGTRNGEIVIRGKGHGHGVGLCQWGARGSAMNGMDYRQILEKYYPGTKIRRAY